MVSDCAKWNIKWHIDRYASELAYRHDKKYNSSRFEGNLLLHEGINDGIWAALVGDLVTPFDNTNAYIGVGNSSGAVGASQTGLLGSPVAYMPMEDTYPIYGTDQAITFKSIFASGDGNFAWEEFTVANGDANTDINLNRKLSAQGTKQEGQVWTVSVTITLS
jgi:hypothetical protein